MKRSLLIVCPLAVVGLAGAVVEWSRRAEISAAAAELESYDIRDGKAEAEADLARGLPKWKVVGLYRSSDEDAARLKRLGISVDWFAGCVVTAAVHRYRYTYNSAIYAHYIALVGQEMTEEVLGAPPIDFTVDDEEG